MYADTLRMNAISNYLNLLLIKQIKMSDIKEAKKTCKDVLISDATRNRLLHQEEGLTTIQGLDVDLSWFKLKPEQWIRILEQV